MDRQHSIELLKRARQYINEGRSDAAAPILTALSAIKPDAEVLLLQAQSAQRQDRPDQARALFCKALEIAPDHIPVRVALGRLYLEQGEPDQAVETLEGLSSEASSTPMTGKLKAQAFVAKGQPLAAAALLRDVFRANRDETAAARKAIKLFWSAGERQSAGHLAGELLDVLPQDLDMRRLRVRVLIAEDAVDALATEGPALAAADAEWGMRIARRLRARQLLPEAATILQAIGPERDGDHGRSEFSADLCERLVEQADKAKSEGDFPKMIRALRSTLSLRPDSRVVRRELTRTFRRFYAEGVDAAKVGRHAEAGRLLALALDSDDTSRSAWLWLAKCAVGAGDGATALRAFQRVSALYPDDIGIAHKLARMAERTGDLVTALQTAQKVARSGLQEAEEMVGRLANKVAREARRCLKSGDLTEAERLICSIRSAAAQPESIADLAARLVKLLVRLARQEKHRKQYAAAIDLARRALAQEPRDLSAMALLAEIYRVSRQFQQAAEAYRRLTDAAPDSASAWTGLAASLHRTGATDDALGAAERALHLEPNNQRAASLQRTLTALAPSRPGPALKHQSRRRRSTKSG